MPNQIKKIDIVFALIILVLTAVYSTKPQYNWDIIGYMSSILLIDGVEKSTINNRVYESLEEQIPKAEYNEIKGKDGEFGGIVRESPQSLSELTPTYIIKLLYNTASYAFYKMGFSLSYSTVIPSLLSFLALIYFLYYVFRRHTRIQPLIIALILLVIATMKPVELLARLSTPDAMSTFFIVIIAYCFILKKNFYLILSLMVLALLTRPDNILFINSLLLCRLLLKDETQQWVTIFVSILGMTGLYFLLSYYSNYPGWSVWFYHSFIEKQSFPRSDPPSLSLSDYLNILIYGFYHLKNILLTMLLTAVLLWYFTDLRIKNFRLVGKWKIYHATFIAVAATMVLRTFLFPYWDWNFRFYSGYYMILLMIGVFIFSLHYS